MHKNRYLIITVDTEGDNLWRKMFTKNAVEHRTGVNNANYLPRFQHLCEQYGFVPTYLVDYEMASAEPLIEMAKHGRTAGKLEIGMHMHAWSCPPYYAFPPERKAVHGNPYIGEYPTAIIEQKVDHLLERLKEKFGIHHVTAHRSGRWQLDARYVKILHERGIFADCSVTPGVDWSTSIGLTEKSGGSDYRSFPVGAYEMDISNIGKAGVSGFYEVPVTIQAHGDSLVWLRPTGKNLGAMIELVHQKTAEHAPYLEFMIHSSELMPFGSPNFQTESSIEKLYQDMDALFAEISKEYKGIGLTDYVRKTFLQTDRGELI